MKSHWEGPIPFVKNLLQKQKGIIQKHKTDLLPTIIIVKVKEFNKNKYVLLRWQGELLSAKVDIPVHKGEYLLLKHKGVLGGERYYKVIARSMEPITASKGKYSSAVKHLYIYNYESKIPVPLLIRYNLPFEDEGNMDGHDRDGEVEDNYCLDFIVKGQNLGLVIIRIERKSGHYFGKLLFESSEVNALMLEDIKELKLIMSRLLKEVNIHLQQVRIEIIPSFYKNEIFGSLSRINYGLDEKV